MRHRLPLPAVPAPGSARWSRWVPPGACLASAIAAVAVMAAGLPVAAASAPGPAGPSAAPVTAAGQATTTTIPLIAGGQVVVTTAGGRRSFLVRGAAGAAVTYQDAAGDQFVVPAVAVPYVGKQLSPSLFDVSALARDGITGGARIPVDLRFAPGARVTAPPGVTLTWTRGQVARGYVTAASGRRLAAALAAQDGADTAGGHLAAAGRLLGGLTAMTLAAPGAPAPPQADYPLHILRLKVTDLAGKPANNALVVVMNTDNARRELTGVPVANGIGRVAVPAGDYMVWGGFEDFTPAGKFAGFHLVMRNDFQVPATSKTTTVTIAERSATLPVSVTVPRPAKAQQAETLFDRVSAAGGGVQVGAFNFPVSPLYVNPQPAPRLGRLHYLERWSGGALRRGYWYDTAFAFPDIPADEHFVVHASQIATVHEHFFADPASGSTIGGWTDDPYDPNLATPFRSPAGLIDETTPVYTTMPRNLTVYIGTASGDQWVQSDFSPNFTYLAADPHTFLPGHSYRLDWAHGPLAPTLGQHTGPWQCQACTAGRTLALNFSAAGDSEPDHVVPFFQDITSRNRVRFTLYQNGTRLFTGRGTGAVVRNVPARPSTYRAVLEVDLAGQKGFSQSTHTLTDLRVRYTPGGGVALPAGDTCAGRSAGSACRVLPALTLGYQLATNQDNTSSSRTQVLHLRVGHVSYSGAGSHARITSAAVWVSFNGGKSWQRASLTGSAGDYTATWPNPASARGTSPEIKVTASDAAGGSITQTITAAYTIAKTSQHRSPR